MNKCGFVLSGITTLIGVVTLIFTKIINSVMPMVGRVAFQSTMSGYYRPGDYYIDFSSLNIASIILITIGLGLGYFFYRRENQ